MSILQLPLELREHIYTFAVQSEYPLRRPKVEAVYKLHEPTSWISEDVTGRNSSAALLCTCRQLETEVAPIFYQMNDFIPYTTIFHDQTDLKLASNQSSSQNCPTAEEWATNSDAEKYRQLGIPEKHIGQIVSLVIYNEVVKNLSMDLTQPNGGKSRKYSNLLAEMLIWLRVKAPQVQCISIRYRDNRTRMLQSLTKGWVVSLTLEETRLYRAIRRFPHLRVLDIRRAHAHYGDVPYWGQWAPLFEVDSRDPRVKRLRGQMLGAHLQRATTAKWITDFAGDSKLKCGVRWGLLLEPRKQDSAPYCAGHRYVAEKLPKILPFEYTWRWSLHSVETWGKAQYRVNYELEAQSVSLMYDIRALKCAGRERPPSARCYHAHEGMWDRMWSLPADVRARIWKSTLRRRLPVYNCARHKGDVSIDALLKVDRRTRRECQWLFVLVNSFSVVPSMAQNPLTTLIIPDAAYSEASTDRLTPLTLPSIGHAAAIRAVHVHMWQTAHGGRASLDRRSNAGFFHVLHHVAPMLSELTIIYYATEDELRQIPSMWHNNALDTLGSFRHLKLVRILFALQDGFRFGTPWMQRLEEVDWTKAPSSHFSQTSATACGPEARDTLVNIPDSNGAPAMPEPFALDILHLFEGRATCLRYNKWERTWGTGELDGIAYRYNILPQCFCSRENQECMGSPDQSPEVHQELETSLSFEGSGVPREITESDECIATVTHT